jgi:DNA-binding GntR family transcriptional regulator
MTEDSLATWMPSFTDRGSFRSTKEQVYWDLRQAIIAGRLSPGQKVSESEIALQLGVSRTPAREALASLREEGLVAIVPQFGTFVTPISEEAVADAVFARTALECAAIRIVAETATPADLELLNGNLEEQAVAEGAADIIAFDALDEALHRHLCDLSGHGIAWTLSRRVSGHLGRVRELGIREPPLLTRLLAAHREIVEAVAAHDPDRAEAALRDHLRRVLTVLPDLRKSYPDFFSEAPPTEMGSIRPQDDANAGTSAR